MPRGSGEGALPVRGRGDRSVSQCPGYVSDPLRQQRYPPERRPPQRPAPPSGRGGQAPGAGRHQRADGPGHRRGRGARPPQRPAHARGPRLQRPSQARGPWPAPCLRRGHGPVQPRDPRSSGGRGLRQGRGSGPGGFGGLSHGHPGVCGNELPGRRRLSRRHLRRAHRHRHESHVGGLGQGRLLAGIGHRRGVPGPGGHGQGHPGPGPQARGARGLRRRAGPLRRGRYAGQPEPLRDGRPAGPGGP